MTKRPNYPHTQSRRGFLKSAAAAAAFAGLSPLGSLLRGHAAAATPASPKMAKRLLFVFSATGGGSLIDSFLATRESEMASPEQAGEFFVYPDAFVKTYDDSPVRALDLPVAYRAYLGLNTGYPYAMSQFTDKYRHDMAVLAVENTSVNHLVAQERAMNGQGINDGRTIAEHIASVHGQSLLLPYVNMAAGGYLAAGTDPGLPSHGVAETVAAPAFFALGTDGMRGMLGAPGGQIGGAPSLGKELARGRALLARARGVRNTLDAESLFAQTFQCSPLLKRYLNRRATTAQDVEDLELFNKLFMFADADLPSISFSDFGIEENADALAARELITSYPDDPEKKMNILYDPQVSQVMLAYLLAKNGYTAASVFGPSFSPNPFILGEQPPIAFDYSHNNHVATQNVMWNRILDLTDKLIQLLKTTPTGEGDTMWDRSLIYIATDFGRDKRRTEPGKPLYTVYQDPVTGNFLPNTHNTGHHLNNGSVLISPLIKPGVFGAVDKNTLLTHGFNRTTGVADPAETIRIGDVYSVIANALDAPFADMIDIPALVPG